MVQAGIGGYKTAAPSGSAPASGDLRKSSLWDDSARTSCGQTDADCTDKVLAPPCSYAGYASVKHEY